MLRAILFDLGDTLIDFEPMDTRSIFREAAADTYRHLQQCGCALPPFQRYCAVQFSAMRWSYFWSKLTGREFNSLELLARLHRRMHLPDDHAMLVELAWKWYQPLIAHSRAEAEILPILNDLRTRGYKLGLISNTFVPGMLMDRHLETFGLLEFFPVRVYSSEVRYRKPNRRIFQIALDALGVTGPDAMFVGDLVKTDIVGARRVGMSTVLKQPWGTSKAHQAADHIVRRLTELPALLGNGAAK